jgi:hypothetical protein
VEQDDQRWARPGRPPTPAQPGLIDPAQHGLPPVPSSARTPAEPTEPPPSAPPADATEPPEPELAAPDPARANEQLQLGGPARRRSVRVLVATLGVLLLVAGAGVTGLQLRDAQQTLTQEQLGAAITSFRPELSTGYTELQGPEELTSSGVQTDPAACRELIDPTPDGALGGASWSDGSSPASTEIQAVRYARPRDARRALADVKAALRDCPRGAVVSSRPDDDGFAFTADAEEVGWPAARDRVRYRLRSEGSGDEDGFAIYARRYGNVVTWSSGTPTSASRAAADDLVARLRVLATT